MSLLKNYVDKLVNTDLNLLVQGETGTGKEMLVNYIKEASGVAKVVSVNCAAIPKDLAESILFGHKKGAFTGAHNDQIGKLEEAQNGILFLDEIGELNLEVQAKFLRAIQESKITPVGGYEKSVDFKLICATHRDLEKMIEEGNFREDLYFRINEAHVHLPNLEERCEDIPALALLFADEVISANKIPKKIIKPEVLKFLKNKKWRGNIRELKGFIRKLILLTDDEVLTLDSLNILTQFQNSNSKTSQFPNDLQEAKRIFVESHVLKVLETCGGNKTKTAKVLGITTRNLYRLLPKNFDINDRGN